uniref:Uncharacterized protein n=1 Tax=Setaria italica TaxID=4555 RepID=K3YF83_SETIT
MRPSPAEPCHRWSVSLSVVVGFFYMWGCEQILQMYPDERCKIKESNMSSI